MTPISAHGQMHAIPGIFFIYEPSPFLVTVSDERQPFMHYLTNVCAIIGGAFTVRARVCVGASCVDAPPGLQSPALP